MPKYFPTFLTPETFGDAFKKQLRQSNEALGFSVAPPLGISNLGGGPTIYLDRVAEVLIGKPDADIAARSGTTAGSGTVSLWDFGTDGALYDTTEEVTAYNLSSTAVTSGSYVMLSYHRYSGKWLVSFEDCG